MFNVNMAHLHNPPPPMQNNYSLNGNQAEDFLENYHPYIQDTNFSLHSSLLRDDPASCARRLTYSSQLFPAGGDALYQVSSFISITIGNQAPLPFK